MIYASVCSGIEAVSVAVDTLGWQPAFFSEIEAFPSAVLAHRFPGVRNLGDFTLIGEEHGPVDVLAGGTPCQDFSIAGLRAGMAGERGNLTLEFLRLASRLRPRWILWENVPGVLSSWTDSEVNRASEKAEEIAEAHRSRDRWTRLALDEAALSLGDLAGRLDGLGAFVDDARSRKGEAGLPLGCDEVVQRSDFSCFLAGLRELGYGFAWRILDAQFAGLAQRRERVFVVAHAGGLWQRAAAVLLEPEGVSGNSPPRREAGESVAGTLDSRASGGGGGPGGGTDGACGGYVQPCEVAPPVTAKWAKGSGGPAGDECQNIIGCLAPGAHPGGANGQDAYTGQLIPVAFDPAQVTSVANRSNPQPGSPCHTLHQGPALLAFTSKDRGADAGELAPTLRAMGHSESHANGGGQVAIAIDTYNQTTNQTTNQTLQRGTGTDALGAIMVSAAFPIHGAAIGRADNAGPMGPTFGEPESPCFTLDTTSRHGVAHEVSHALRGEGHDASEDGTGRGTPIVPCYGQPVGTTGHQGDTVHGEADAWGTLSAHGGNNGDGGILHAAFAVRRLLPVETEKLQGFPPGWTDIPMRRAKPFPGDKSLRKKSPERFRMIGDGEWVFAADSPRYKAIGNSMAVPVMRLICERIDFIDKLPLPEERA